MMSGGGDSQRVRDESLVCVELEPRWVLGRTTQG